MIEFKFAKNWQVYISKRFLKPVGVRIAFFELWKKMDAVLRCLLPAELKQFG